MSLNPYRTYNLSCSSKSFSSVLPGHSLAGIKYVNKELPAKNAQCWMELTVYDNIPLPSSSNLFSPSFSSNNKNNNVNKSLMIMNKPPYVSYEKNKDYTSNNNKSASSRFFNTTTYKNNCTIINKKDNNDNSINNKADIRDYDFAPSVTLSNYEEGNRAVFIDTFIKAVETQQIKPINRFIIKFELFVAECPKICQNFLRLCNSSGNCYCGIKSGINKSCSDSESYCKCRSFEPRTEVIYEDKPMLLTYKGTFFHKIIPNFICQGGDLTRRIAGGTNKFSSFSSSSNSYINNVFQFEDENLKRSFDQHGLLGMANNGPNTNGSQFFITTYVDGSKVKSLDGRHCCFGKVIEGLDQFMEYVSNEGNYFGVPTRHVVVTECGID